MPELYKPTGCIDVFSDKQQAKMMLGVVGASASGKTVAGASFPNPVFLNLNNGLTWIKGNPRFKDKNIVSVEAWSDKYCLEVLKWKRHVQLGARPSEADPVNRRDGIMDWVKTEGRKLTSDQTLIVDSWTDVQTWFDIIKDREPVYDKKGDLNPYNFWDCKIEYSEDLMSALKGLSCHVVIIFHESQERDKVTQQLIDKIQPLMQGKYVTKISQELTDFFRQHCVAKLDSRGQPTTKINGSDIDPKLLTEDVNYLWQIKSDAFFNAKTRMNRPERFVKADFSSFQYATINF